MFTFLLTLPWQQSINCFRKHSQEPSAVSRDDPLEVRRAVDGGTAEEQEGRVLGHGARVRWTHGDMGRAAGGGGRRRGDGLRTSSGHPRRRQRLRSQRFPHRVLRRARLQVPRSYLLPQLSH